MGESSDVGIRSKGDLSINQRKKEKKKKRKPVSKLLPRNGTSNNRTKL